MFNPLELHILTLRLGLARRKSLLRCGAIPAEWRLLAPGDHPRTNQTTSTPNTADTTPANRKLASGASFIIVMARRVAAGKAANASPSITSTRPRAATKSRIRG